MQIDTPNKIYTPAKPDLVPVLPARPVRPVDEQKQERRPRKPLNPDSSAEAGDSPNFDDYA